MAEVANGNNWSQSPAEMCVTPSETLTPKRWMQIARYQMFDNFRTVKYMNNDMYLLGYEENL